MENTVAEKVCTIREVVAEQIGDQKFRTWFGDTQFLLLPDRLDIAADNAFAVGWIHSNYMPVLARAAQQVLGAEIKVDVRVAQSMRRPIQSKPAAAMPPAPATADVPGNGGKPPRADVQGTLRGDLASFVVGSSNELAYSAACTVVRTLASEFKPLVMYGGCGLGKTHLLQGICNAVRLEQPTWAWRYVSGEEFTNEFVYAVKSGRVDAFRARFRKVDLLVVDDIHFLANKKATQEEFLHTFNAIDSCGKQVVLSSDLHPRSIASLSEPLANRLISGMVVKIGTPDLNTRREILSRRAVSMNSDVPGDVLDHLARHIVSNVRELEGALYKLVALASLSRQPITIDLARAALDEYLSRNKRPTDAADIEHVVAERFGLIRERLHSKMRDRTVSLARAISMYLVRKHTHMSFPEIGRAMGDKNHSTVLMAKRKIESILATNGTVTWITSSGKQEALLSELLAKIEQNLTQRRD